MSPPDGLLTLGLKHDVELEPRTIAPDPFASDDSLDVFSPQHRFLLTKIEEPNTMITGEDEPSSGLNGRLRPRKANVPCPQTIKTTRKSDPKPTQEKPKRTSTPSKASPNKPDDLTNKSESPSPHILCPYCDKTFFTKQAISKHIRRVHIITTNDNLINCLFCNHIGADANDIIRHMVDNHPNQYFACYDCHTRFSSTTELAVHKHNICEKQKLPYRNKLRPKTTPKKSLNTLNISTGSEYDDVENAEEQEFNGLVISCELKTSQAHDGADIEDNITTNFILPAAKNINNSTTVIEKNAVIILDDLQWNKRSPTNFSFHNTDADQILSRLGVVHRSPRAGDFNKRDWPRNIDEPNQKFEKCFDTSFYSKVASNVQENLAKFLDGSFNFNPDPENTIKTRKSKNSVAINTVEGFPILLECAQFSRNVFDRYLPRGIAPKHKWKWDSLENFRNLPNPVQFKNDTHSYNCIISLVSSLDIWTQLCMREKYEQKFNKSTPEKKSEKQNTLGNELKEILESRELPTPTTSSEIVKYNSRALPARDDLDFPISLGLVPSPPAYNPKPAVLSGEWVRPRCYVCCACGAQIRDSRALSSHISSRHPNAQIQHYEIVGDVLLKSDILKHLYVPPSQPNNRTRPLRGIRECTKCRKSISLDDLHQHMLDCAGDTPAVRRKCRYRPFGVRKRRHRLPDNTIRREMRKDIRTQHNRKSHMRPRPKIRTEVGDAETIRKMLADLPAKRHRVTVNPLSPILRPRRKLNTQRNKMIMKKRPTEDVKKKPVLNMEPQDRENNENNNPARHPIEDQNNEDNPRPPQDVALQIANCIENSLNKPLSNKNKRKSIPHKEPQDSSDKLDLSFMIPKPSDGQENFQIEQLSTNHNSERIFINGEGGGSYRERSNESNNGSNNRDNNNSGYSEQHHNSRDFSAPSQNIPLKHSIASLTASSETHDKSVQFHHLFLVQQECNDVNNHVPSGQKTLFENEAVVTKLDKPPLHFNHPGIYVDSQLFQKNKLNKPRKKLTDCIAMLKNKLEEPHPNTLPGHVSVQCGSDEPLGPEPIIIERRHSTTESNNESTQRSLQMLYPDISPENIAENLNIPKRPTRRRSTTTRQRTTSAREKLIEMQTNNDYVHWKQYYYEPQMYSAQNVKRQPIRRKSLTPADGFLLQHAYMNLELLNKSNRDLQNLSEYHYSNLATMSYKTNKKRGRETIQKPNSRRQVNEISKAKPKELPKTRERTSRTRRTRVNSQQMSQILIQDTSAVPVINQNDQYTHPAAVACSTYVPDKTYDCCTIASIQDENINVCVEEEIPHSNTLIDKQALHHVDQQNTQVIEYSSDNSIPQTIYTVPYEHTAGTAPLDLSNNVPHNDNSYQYLPETQFCPVNYETYETLDLSNRNLNNEEVKETEINNEVVVDLSLRYSSHPPHESRLTPIPSDIGSNEIEEGPTDLSIVRVDDYTPTDLSVRRRIYPVQSYERTVEGYTQDNLIQDLSQPARHADNVGLLMTLRAEIENDELPTDLSKKRCGSRPDVTALCLTEQQDIYLNVFRNNPVPADDDTPADLSARKNDVQNVQYIESQAMNVNDRLNIHGGINRQTALSNEQVINLHYNSGYPTAIPASYSVNSDSFDDRNHKVSNSRIISPSSTIHDYSNNSSLEEPRLSHTNEVISYAYSDIPLSLTTNTKQINRNPEASNICNVMYCPPVTKVNTLTYEVNGPSYVIPSEPNCSSIADSNSSISSASCGNRNCFEINVNDSPETNERTVERNVNLTQEAEGTHNLLPINENQNCKVTEINKKLTKTPNLDQDPETARKIAMLPKELVEILGNMPVDHRNQLLNVLPQYVSTSTASETSLPETPQKIVEENCSLSKKRFDNVIDVSKDISIQEDNNSMTSSASPTSRYPDSPHISLTSSVLLTPPTPQLSERNSIQSQENDDMKSNSRERRVSNEDEIHVVISKSDKNEMNINIDKRFNQLENDAVDDSIIDLTDDDYLAPYEYENNSQLKRSKDISKDYSLGKSTSSKPSHKVNNDKTASLRAVRIKTPSERNRYTLLENNTQKNAIENGIKQINEKIQNNNFDTQKSFVIQRTEGSTEYNTANSNNNNNNTSYTQDKCADLNANNLTSSNSKCKTTKKQFFAIKNVEKVTNESTDSFSILKEVDDTNEKTGITIFNEKVTSGISKTVLINSPQKNDIFIHANTKGVVTDVNSKTCEKAKKCEYVNDNMDVIHICEDSEDVSLTSQATQQGKHLKALPETSQKSSHEFNTEKCNYKSTLDTERIGRNKQVITVNDFGSVSFEEFKLTKPSNDILERRQEVDSDGQNKGSEIAPFRVQKSKTDQCSERKTKYLENNDQVYHNSDILKSEITNVNNYSDVKNKEKAIQESVIVKIAEKHIENVDRSTIPTKNSKNIKENDKALNKENSRELIEKTPESNSLQINAFITIKEGDDSNDKLEVTVKQSEKCLASLSAQNSTKIEPNISEIENTALVKYGSVENTNTISHSKKDNVITFKDKINKKGDILLNEAEEMKSKHVQNLDISKEGGENKSPVRRSRRRKSQSLQNHHSETENFQPEDETKLKTSSKQKYLISANAAADNDDKLCDDDLSEHKIYYESPISPSGTDLDEDIIETTKSNKRKKLPQSKRKYKKKRGLTSVKARIDIRIERLRTDSKFSIEGSIVTNNIKTAKSNEVPKIRCSDEDPEVALIPLPDEDIKDKKGRGPIEKRKSNSPSRSELVSNWNPKKCKLDNDKESTQGELEEKRSEEKQLTETQMSETKTLTVFKNTTCYNKPARRMRSKSVVVKSSGVKLYDPYDIDFEDMADKTEPFKRKEITSRGSFANFKPSSPTDIDNVKESFPSTSKQDAPLDHLKPSTSSTLLLSESQAVVDENTISTKSETRTKDLLSDTDDSSKSDEPLKKYAIIKEIRSLVSSDLNDECSCSRPMINLREKPKTRGRKKRTLSSNTKVERNIQNENDDEELRSQQFMESFGFFSERKPRKSNLLATKKISETFHIIATENDDIYFSSLERINKKSVTVSKKVDGSETGASNSGVISKKIPAKRGRKKKIRFPFKQAFCGVCKKIFRRSDNFTRHQITLYHIARLSEEDEPNKTTAKEDGPNFLIVFKQQLDRLKIMRKNMETRRKKCLPVVPITVPTLLEMVEEVKRNIKEQVAARRVLSRDEALFVDCCEMLKESNQNDVNNRRRNCNSYNCLLVCEEELAALERSLEDKDDKNDGDVDSITAKTIMESEEVRNLENDLISGLKEANGLKGPNNDYRPLVGMEANANGENAMASSNYQSVDDFDQPSTSKGVRSSELKNRNLCDVVENVDIFEDKFDKIKRKCRSQAAAAKQIQPVADANSSQKDRKKSEKRKAKRGSKKNHSAVPTKGALKGFDGIKVSIPKSDINMSAIVQPLGNSSKRKKKSRSKKKKERKSSDGSSKYDSESYRRNKESPQNNLDVYEFMDTEDTELFEFRPSTLMERFKSISSNKEVPSTSKASYAPEIPEASSESGSDGDDFVYMSDDYVCSDDETENSILSCEFGNVKGNNYEYKKPASPLKRKDVIEKNAVMGKIFKHNALRSERKRSRSKELVKPKANLDQLFDSLLEDGKQLEMSSKNDSFDSMQRTLPSKEENTYKTRNENIIADLQEAGPSHVYESIPSTSTASIQSSKKRKSLTPPRKLDLNAFHVLEYEHSSKRDDNMYKNDLSLEHYPISPHVVSNKFSSSEDEDFTVPKLSRTSHHKTQDLTQIKNRSKDKGNKDKSSSKRRLQEERRKSYDSDSESSSRTLAQEASGVAVQRARRKCTVGKQNVLAESWSSESEPDGAPQRPNSVESVVTGPGRKKRGRKRERTGFSRPRPSSYWSDGEDDHEHEHDHPQQHGWIVGDSHKKLVTMLAHAKGRRRNDDKRSAVLE